MVRPKIGSGGISESRDRCLLPNYFRSSRAVVRRWGYIRMLDVDDGAAPLQKASVPSLCADSRPIRTSMRSQIEVQ